MIDSCRVFRKRLYPDTDGRHVGVWKGIEFRGGIDPGEVLGVEVEGSVGLGWRLLGSLWKCNVRYFNAITWLISTALGASLVSGSELCWISLSIVSLLAIRCRQVISNTLCIR